MQTISELTTGLFVSSITARSRSHSEAALRGTDHQLVMQTISEPLCMAGRRPAGPIVSTINWLVKVDHWLPVLQVT